jgi:hypothetical protein
MGRHAIIGNEFCPVPTCCKLILGRFVTKKVRNRSTGRYVERSYYRHNDGTEHYVDNYVRKMQMQLLEIHPFGDAIKLFKMTADEVAKVIFYQQKAAGQIRTFPLTEEDNIKLKDGYKYANQTASAMARIIQILYLGLRLRLEGKEVPKWLEIEEQRLMDLIQLYNEQKAAINKLLTENPLEAMTKSVKALETHPLRAALYSVYNKYEIPKRRQRYRDKGKLPSKYPYESKKPGNLDYSDIEDMK